MHTRSTSVLLAATLLTIVAALPAQQVTWNLDRHATAEYRRALERPALPSGDAGILPKRASTRNLIRNASFEEVNRSKPKHWSTTVFAGDAELESDDEQAHTGRHSARISAAGGADAIWTFHADVRPDTTYRLSGWIKSEKITHRAGARLNVAEFGKSKVTPGVAGTTDWTEVQLEFNSAEHTRVRINCMFGGWRRARGKAWFDDIRLIEIAGPAPAPETMEATVFAGARRPAHVRGDELDSRRQYLAEPVRDLRDLPAHLAFDMRRARGAGTLRPRILTTTDCEPVRLEVTYGPVLEDGTQQIEARLRALKSPRSRKGGAARPRVSGTVRIERRVDVARQRVAHFSSDLRLQVEMPEGWPVMAEDRRFGIEIKETFTWLRTNRADDGKFQARVNEAIRSGGRYLRGHAATKGLGPGPLGLVILTLLKAGEEPRDPLMAKLLGRLRKAKLRRTYELSVAIMAIEAIYAPPDERDHLLAGKLSKPVTREPTTEDRACLERWVKKLLQNIDTRVDSAYIRRWHYNRGKQFDNSNTQYAMLGLYTAMLCGVEVSNQVWFASANHWLETQAPSGNEAAPLKLVSHRELKNATRTRLRRTVRTNRVKPRGWTYRKAGARNGTGSMTAAGITGLVICDSALRRADKGSVKLRNRISDSVQSGFAWLAANFSVEKNPGGPMNWHYYYLYGLERACEINGTALLNGCHWYFEGADYLLRNQLMGGDWGSVQNTCFAILFLKKAAPPVFTGPR